ncbi:MAG: S-layer homology domain-containing protein [bacterium]
MSRAGPAKLAAALAAALAMLHPGASFALFEYHLFYNAGAASYALGPGGMPSLDDPLGFVINPATLGTQRNKRFFLSFVNMTRGEPIAGNLLELNVLGIQPGDQYEFVSTGLGVVHPGKDAIAVFRSREPGLSYHDEITYTISRGRPEEEIVYGANLRVFRFKERAGTGKSGFLIDLGMYHSYRDNVHYGVVLRNIISSSPELSRETWFIDSSIPKTLSLGVVYQRDEKMRLYGSYEAEIFSDALFRDRFRRFNIGLEYLLGGNYTGRGSVSRHDMLTGADDNYASGGAGFRRERLGADFAFMMKNYPFNRGSALTFSIESQPEAPPPPQVVEEEKPPEPLPVISSEEELGEEPEEEEAPRVAREREVRELEELAVEPDVILAAQPFLKTLEDLDGHWSETSVKKILENGYFFDGVNGKFHPSDPVGRDEFYRLVFTVQLERLFRVPLQVKYFTPVAGAFTAELEGGAQGGKIGMVSVEVEKQGWQSVVVQPEILEEKRVAPGRYTLVCTLESDSGTFTGEAPVTVLDTLLDFGKFERMAPADRKKEVETMKESLKALGVPLDYLDNLARDGNVTRIEALDAIFESRGVKAPAEADDVIIFSDVWSLGERQKRLVYLASRGMKPLGGVPFMAGYDDGTFRPAGPLTRAEAATLIVKLRGLGPGDFEPPFAPPSGIRATLEYAPKPVTPKEGIEAKQKPAPPETLFWLIALSTLSVDGARDFARRLLDEGRAPVIVKEIAGTAPMYHIVVGMYRTHAEAEAAKASLEAGGYQIYLRAPSAGGAAPLTTTVPPEPGAKKERKRGVNGEVSLDNPPPVPDNLDTTTYKTQETEHSRYKLITK